MEISTNPFEALTHDLIDMIGTFLSPYALDLVHFRATCKHTRNACESRQAFKHFLMSELKEPQKYINYTSTLVLACNTHTKYKWSRQDLTDIFQNYAYSPNLPIYFSGNRIHPSRGLDLLGYTDAIQALEGLDYTYRTLPKINKMAMEVVTDTWIQEMERHFEANPKETRKKVERLQFTKMIYYASLYGLSEQVPRMLPYVVVKENALLAAVKGDYVDIVDKIISKMRVEAIIHQLVLIDAYRLCKSTEMRELIAAYIANPINN